MSQNWLTYFVHIILPSIQKSLFVGFLNQKVRLTIRPFAKKNGFLFKIGIKGYENCSTWVGLIHAIRSFRLSIYVLTIIS
jgi:hypothetical protein